MTAHDHRISRAAAEFAVAGRKKKHNLWMVDLSVLAKRFVVFTPTDREIQNLIEKATHEMGGGALPSVVQRVAAHNPDSFWAIGPRDHFSTTARIASGYLAFLMLNETGLRRLLDGELDATNPDLSLIVRQNEKPAGIYVWGAYASGLAAGGVPLAFEKVWSRLYRDVDLFARAVTLEGRQMLDALGFEQGARFDDRFFGNFFQYRRSPPDPRKNPAYDTYRAGASDDVAITVAHSIEDIMRVVSIRGAVYMAEQKCPYDEEFDGNDFCGSHLIAYVGDEPAGCLRVRNFAEFAKLERLAVRREFRHFGLGTRLMKAGIELSRTKGYKRIYGHAQKRLLPYYVSMGFRQFPGERELSFSGYDYVEIVYDADQSPEAITLGMDPYVVLRPEGQWHDIGILEKSADACTPKYQGAAA
jgi:predicted GNAT family N-acyltransferase